MKLHEEFKEYENLWEAAEENKTSLMWTLPNGEEIDLNDDGALTAEQERVVAIENELRDQGKLDPAKSPKANSIKHILSDIRQELIKINDKDLVITDKGTNTIINKLKNYTDLGDKVDLEDIRRQLNAHATAVYKEQCQRYLDRLNGLLKYAYETSGAIE